MPPDPSTFFISTQQSFTCLSHLCVFVGWLLHHLSWGTIPIKAERRGRIKAQSRPRLSLARWAITTFTGTPPIGLSSYLLGQSIQGLSQPATKETEKCKSRQSCNRVYYKETTNDINHTFKMETLRKGSLEDCEERKRPWCLFGLIVQKMGDSVK